MPVIGQRGYERSGVQTEACAEEERGEEESTQTVLREIRKEKEDRGRGSQFSEDLQTLLFGQLCLSVL